MAARLTIVFFAFVSFMAGAGAAYLFTELRNDASTESVVHHNGTNIADHMSVRKLISIPHDNPADYILAQGRKLISIPHDNPADYILLQGRKVAAGTTVSVPHQQHHSGINPADYILARKLTGGAGAVSATQACDELEGNKKACYTITKLPGVTTPRALLEAALRVALGRARALKATFDAAKAASKAGNPMASILGSCDKNYDDLVGALEEATRALHKGGSSYNLVTKMSAASTYATDCDNWFSERSLTSPYESVQRHAAQAVSVALGVAAKNKNL